MVVSKKTLHFSISGICGLNEDAVREPNRQSVIDTLQRHEILLLLP